MWEYFLKGLIGLFLITTAVQDIISKKIKVWVVALSTLLVCICIPFCSALTILDRIFGLLLGVGVIILSKATKGKIGMGDGLVLSVTGLGLGFWCNLELFALSLAVAAAFSVCLLILRLANIKHSIPFIPFILVSYLFLHIPIWAYI
ncbi:MAG TPA: hypothetical protein PK304_01290 [Mobilitalea sp.]|nr:hypothetical protein [Mobilitalea sp.]